MAAPNTPRNFAGSVNFDGAKAKEERDYVEEAIEQYRQQLLNPQRQAQPPRGKGKGGGGGGKNRGFKNERRAMPKSNAVGLMQGKDEPDADFALRKSKALPRGARSGAGGGLDEQLFLQEGDTPRDARRRAAILRAEGGEAYRDPKDGKIKTRGVGQRREVDLDGRAAYDPIRERQELMQRGREAVAARKEAQAADDFLVKKREEAIRKPGYVGGFANKYGTGEIKTTTKDKFDKRPVATTNVNRTLTPEEFSKRNTDPDVLRNRGQVSIPLREEVGFMKNDQAAELAAYKDAQAKNIANQRKKLLSSTTPVAPKMKGGEVHPEIKTMITGEDGPELQFKREDGSIFVIPADITRKITAGLEMENSKEGKESLKAIKGGKVTPRMQGGLDDEVGKILFKDKENERLFVKDRINANTIRRGGVRMPGMHPWMSATQALAAESRGGVPMPGLI